jgi:hypothetical protein
LQLQALLAIEPVEEDEFNGHEVHEDIPRLPV